MRVFKYLMVILAIFSLFACSELETPKPKRNFKSGENTGFICLKRSTQHELIYTITPKYKDRSYYVDSQVIGNNVYIYTLYEDKNNSKPFWNKLIPLVPNTEYVPRGPINVYWGNKELFRGMGVKEKGCFKVDEDDVFEINKENIKERAKDSAIESAARALVESYWENLLLTP